MSALGVIADIFGTKADTQVSQVANCHFMSADLPPSDGAKGKLGNADLKEGYHTAQEVFG
jgi:hypothetical protein